MQRPAATGAINANAITGLTVIVTRPQPQAAEWVAQLQARGLHAGALPLLGIDGPADPAPVHQAWLHLPAQAVVMFVSPSAVQRFFALRPGGMVWPSQVIAAGTGPGTRLALLQAGVPHSAVLTPDPAAGQFDSEALWALLAGRIHWPGQQVLIVRGAGGRDWLSAQLRQSGAQVHWVEAYRRTAPEPDTAALALLTAALAQPAAHVWLFSSSEAAGHLPALAPGADWRSCSALVTHPRIAEAVQALGFGRVQLVAPALDAVVAVVGVAVAETSGAASAALGQDGAGGA